MFDADNSGVWTQILGGKAYEPEASRLVENAILPTPSAFGAEVGGDSVGIVEIFDIIKLESLRVVCVSLRLRRFGAHPTCDRQPDRQTDRWTRDDSKYRASMASRGSKSNAQTSAILKNEKKRKKGGKRAKKS